MYISYTKLPLKTPDTQLKLCYKAANFLSILLLLCKLPLVVAI